MTFSSYLLESGRQLNVTISADGERETTIRKKSGLLKRRFNGDWISESFDLNSLKDAPVLIGEKFKNKFDLRKLRESDFDFNPGELQRENEYLLSSLEFLELNSWQVTVREQKNRRFVLRKDIPARLSRFDHRSILVRFQLKSAGPWLEIGEGNTEGLPFNGSGLLFRLKEMIKNHRNARDLLSGEDIPLLLCPGDGGIFFHEILGHSLEADFIWQGVSPFKLDDINRKIVSRGITLSTRNAKDPFFRELLSDDEGEGPGPDILVEDGVVRGFISDNFHKFLTKSTHPGHARVADYSCIPQPRMFSLYLQSGSLLPEEILASCKRGIYAREFGTGKVFFDKDLFIFQINQAQLIENGKLGHHLGAVVVSGSITEALNSVSQIGNDFQTDRGISYCQKNGQTVNVRVGQPTVKVDRVNAVQVMR